MAKAGDVLENPVTGERFRFLKTAQDTDGELLQFELTLRPGGRVPVDHVHTRQEERFEVLAGAVKFRVGRDWRSASADDTLVVPIGLAHGLRNESGEEARVIVEFRPALTTERNFETLCGLARDGKIGKSGVPNFVHASVLGREYATFLAGPPIPLQRAGALALAPLARLLGYRAYYDRYSEPQG